MKEEQNRVLAHRILRELPQGCVCSPVGHGHDCDRIVELLADRAPSSAPDEIEGLVGEWKAAQADAADNGNEVRVIEAGDRMAAALARVTAERDKEEQAHLATIDQRDEAEEAISQAYYLVIGESPEWSNNFCHDDAVEEIVGAVNLLKEAAKTAAAERDATEIACKLANKSTVVAVTRADKAEAEVERLRLLAYRNPGACERDLVSWRQIAEAAEAERGRLAEQLREARANLRRYGGHTAVCSSHHGPECCCGWQEINRALASLPTADTAKVGENK